MLNIYFRKPIFWDYTLSLIIAAIVFKLYRINVISLPKEDYTISTITDLSTIGLTLAGFILTLLTVLITFKSGNKVTNDRNIDDNTVFELFFTTGLYFETVGHLKNAVKSLIAISVAGYSFKLLLSEDLHKYIYFYNIFGLVVITLTLWRSLLIMVKVINLQKGE